MTVGVVAMNIATFGAAAAPATAAKNVGQAASLLTKVVNTFKNAKEACKVVIEAAKQVAKVGSLGYKSGKLYTVRDDANYIEVASREFPTLVSEFAESVLNSHFEPADALYYKLRYIELFFEPGSAVNLHATAMEGELAESLVGMGVGMYDFTGVAGLINAFTSKSCGLRVDEALNRKFCSAGKGYGTADASRCKNGVYGLTCTDETTKARLIRFRGGYCK
jgi:hypothetical protein